jgi:hypothetical protein
LEVKCLIHFSSLHFARVFGQRKNVIDEAATSEPLDSLSLLPQLYRQNSHTNPEDQYNLLIMSDSGFSNAT